VVQPLLELQQLQQLSILFCDTSADELRDLCNLRLLTNICLRYTGDDAASMLGNSAAGWGAIAPKVRAIGLYFYRNNALSAPVTCLQQLSCLTAVTNLGLDVNVGPLSVTASQLACVLLNLQQLQVLEISTDTLQTPLFMPAAEAAAAAAAAQQAAAVVAANRAEVAREAAAAAAANNAPNAADLAEAAAAGAAAVAAVAAWEAAAAAGDEAAAAGDGQAGAGAAGNNAAPADGGAVEGAGNAAEAADVEVAAAAASSLLNQLVPLTRAIAQLPQLVSLKLKGAGTTVEAVEHITSLTRLTRLTISGLGFDDAALNNVACSLTGLRRLSLSDATVTDAPLMVVARMLQRLTEVELSNCDHVTDRGVRWLAQLPCLQVVDVGNGSGISDAAVAAALRNA
jgi:hypothetical protein